MFRQVCIGLAALVIFASDASAAPIPLTLNQAAPQTLGPQSASAPCIIAGTQCQNPGGFPFTNFTQGGNISASDELSPIYNVEQFPFLTFDIAIDVNTNSSASETLEQFSVFIDVDGEGGPGGFEEIYAFLNGPTVIGAASSPGNGFADWTLGAVDLTSYGADALVQFQAVWSGAVAGAESFFLVAAETPTPVSEPGTLALMGLALLAMGVWRRRARAPVKRVRDRDPYLP